MLLRYRAKRTPRDWPGSYLSYQERMVYLLQIQKLGTPAVLIQSSHTLLFMFCLRQDISQDAIKFPDSNDLPASVSRVAEMTAPGSFGINCIYASFVLLPNLTLSGAPWGILQIRIPRPRLLCHRGPGSRSQTAWLAHLIFLFTTSLSRSKGKPGERKQQSTGWWQRACGGNLAYEGLLNNFSKSLRLSQLPGKLSLPSVSHLHGRFMTGKSPSYLTLSPMTYGWTGHYRGAVESVMLCKWPSECSPFVLVQGPSRTSVRQWQLQQSEQNTGLRVLGDQSAE